MTHEQEIFATGPSEAVCDFCNAPLTDLPTVFCYPTTTNIVFLHEEHNEDLGMPVDHVDPDGQWAACQPCHDLIEADDYDGLADRSLEHWTDPTVSKQLIKIIILEMHQTFKQHRQGPAWVDPRRISKGTTVSIVTTKKEDK